MSGRTTQGACWVQHLSGWYGGCVYRGKPSAEYANTSLSVLAHKEFFKCQKGGGLPCISCCFGRGAINARGSAEEANEETKLLA